MNVGEALAYGLLGGTNKAADFYVSDWRDRVKSKRDLANEKERWGYQTQEREASQAFQSTEGEKDRTHTTQERKTGQLFSSGEAEKNRAFQAGESAKGRTFTAEQADATVERQRKIAENQEIIKAQYKDKGTQYAWGADGKTLVPVAPGENGAIPLPVGQLNDGKFSYLGTGKDGKGLLKGSTGSSKSTGGYETVKTPGNAGITVEGTIYRDPDTGEEYQYIRNPQTALLEKAPLQSVQSAPPTSNQITEAEMFAEQAVEEMAKTWSTDATDFAPWGGSRKAAQLYLTQNYLNGTLFDAQGNLIIPGKQPAPAAGQPQAQPQVEPQASVEEQVAQQQSAKLYQSFTQDRQQIVQKFIAGLDQGRNPTKMAERMLAMGFTREQLNTLFPGLIP